MYFAFRSSHNFVAQTSWITQPRSDLSWNWVKCSDRCFGDNYITSFKQPGLRWKQQRHTAEEPLITGLNVKRGQRQRLFHPILKSDWSCSLQWWQKPQRHWLSVLCSCNIFAINFRAETCPDCEGNIFLGQPWAKIIIFLVCFTEQFTAAKKKKGIFLSSKMNVMLLKLSTVSLSSTVMIENWQFELWKRQGKMRQICLSFKFYTESMALFQWWLCSSQLFSGAVFEQQRAVQGAANHWSTKIKQRPSFFVSLSFSWWKRCVFLTLFPRFIAIIQPRLCNFMSRQGLHVGWAADRSNKAYFNLI